VQLANERGTTDNVTAVVVSALPAREKPVILIASGPSRLVPAIGLAAAAILILIIAILYIYLT
jgi:hypothetical protein